MELWIRSQSKTELVKIEEVCISIDDDGFIGIWSYGSNKHLKYYLGTYETIERALEVLDEIQKILQPQMILSKVGKPIAETCDGTVYVNPDEYEIKELSTYVYEMPED